MLGGVHILYSAVSKLAYNINERYYDSRHYVWCAPAPSHDALVNCNPESSNPWQICRNFNNAINSKDKHSSWISNNRAGIIRGAAAREAQGVIDAATRSEIEVIANDAELTDFSPLFLVIPYDLVKGLVRRVDVKSTASVLSQEYIIEDLPRKSFDLWPWSQLT
jgi:hypothetical protein